jgi:hypothetical protein
MVSLRLALAGFVTILMTAGGCAAGGAASEKTGPHGAASPGGGEGDGVCTGCDSGTGGDASTSSPDAAIAAETGSPTDTGSPPVETGSPDAGPPSPACPGGPTEIDLHTVTLYSNPPDLADWPVTTTLTEVDFTSAGIALQFSKMDGSGRWPDVTPPGWAGPLQYTIGMVECIGGTWTASAVIEVWYGLPAAGGNVAEDTVTMAQCTAFGAGSSCQVAANWYYDSVRWGSLAGRQPATGETIGIFVAAGNLRNVTVDDPAQSPVQERSNVVLVPMPDITGATHSF